MKYDNKVKIEMLSRYVNESVVTKAVSAFVEELDLSVEELIDVKTAVSEAVNNSIIHGYEGKRGNIIINLKRTDRTIFIEVIDKGKGIEDIEKARDVFYSSKEDMSGMGFTIMDMYMDKLVVESELGKGTKVTMKRTFPKQ